MNIFLDSILNRALPKLLFFSVGVFVVFLSQAGFLVAQEYAPEGYVCRKQKDTCVSALNQTKIWLEGTLNEYSAVALSDGSIVEDLDMKVSNFIGVSTCSVNRDRAGVSDIFCFPIEDAEDGAWKVFQELQQINPPSESEVANDDTDEDDLVRQKDLDTKKCFFGTNYSQVEASCVSSAESKSFEANCLIDQNYAGPAGSVQICHNNQDENTYGDGVKCGGSFTVDLEEEKQGKEAERAKRQELAKRTCERKLDEYFHDGSVSCSTKTTTFRGRSDGAIKMCFDATGLRKKSETEIANLRAAEEARRAQQRAEALRKQKEAYDAQVAEGNQRLKDGGGLVQCYGNCGWVELVQLANRVIKTVIWFAALMMILMILRAGWMLITAQGSVSAAGKAREALTKSIVGFCVVLCAWLIVNAVMNTLAQDYLNENSDVVDLLDD